MGFKRKLRGYGAKPLSQFGMLTPKRSPELCILVQKAANPYKNKLTRLRIGKITLSYCNNWTAEINSDQYAGH